MTYRRPQPRVPLEDSYAGLLQALDGEKAEARPLRLELESCSTLSPEIWLLRVHPAQARLLREDHESWTVAGEKVESVYPWLGEITNVDADEGLLGIRRTGGTGGPVAGKAIYLYEPDYQAMMRRWAGERLRNPLPAAYQTLTAATWRNQPPPRELLAYAAEDVALRPSQRTAVAATGQSVSLVWGPPGTGKTYTLGAAVAALSLCGRKALVLAPTNSAADQATLAIDEARSRQGAPLGIGELLRPGRPSNPVLESRAHLLAWTSALREASREIRSLRQTISDLQRQLLRSGGEERETLNHRLGVLKDQLRKSEEFRGRRLWQLAREARIIVTTLVGGLHHSEVLGALGTGPLALFLDEASMISRYSLVPFLERPPEHLALFGDLRQLGPIRRNSNPNDLTSQHWVGDSCFDLLGARGDSDLQRLERTGALVMLTEQSRTHDGLCQPISKAFYRGQLTTVGNPERPPVVAAWPASGCLLVDPVRAALPATAPQTVSSQVDRREHRCERSAWVSLRLVSLALAERPTASALLLSPFRAQAELLRKLVQAHLSHFPGVRAGTVHVSQGQEADLVVLNPVEPRHPWLTGKFGSREIERLFCVAFSRARIQIVVVARPADVRANPLLGQLCQGASELVT